MTAKTFSKTLIAGAFLLFACTIAANVLLDPEGVFGTNLFPHSLNWNERNDSLLRYKQNASSTDGLLFSSSRGTYLDPELLSRNMGVTHLLSLSVSYGMLADYLPIFEYILRDKAVRHQRIKAVMLLLDLDFFGKTPWTNNNINSFLSPELTGESSARYWWRYLTAFQFRLWRDVVRAELVRRRMESVASTGKIIGPANSTEPNAGKVEPTPIPAVGPPQHAIDAFASERFRRSWNSVRPDLPDQLSKLESFVSLCRDNGIHLTVAVSPMIRENLDLHEPGMIDGLAERISQIVPIWDFNSPPLIASRREYWMDLSHFDIAAGNMMIGRMFGDISLHPLEGFGRFRDETKTPMSATGE